MAVCSETRSPQEICTAYGSDFVPPEPLDKVAVALNTLGQLPLNARRVSPERGICGWYIWGGDGGGGSRTPGFFQTLPVAHLREFQLVALQPSVDCLHADHLARLAGRVTRYVARGPYRSCRVHVHFMFPLCFHLGHGVKRISGKIAGTWRNQIRGHNT